MPTQRQSRKASPAPTKEQVARSKKEFGRNIRPRRGSSPTLLINNPPNKPKGAILLETPGGSSRVLHFQESKDNVFYGPEQQTQTRNSFRVPQLPTFQQPRTYRLIQEERRQNVYDVVYILFAVLIGIVVDVAFGSPFLKYLGIGKGSVSPFVSSVRPFIPSVSSISSNAVRPSL